MSLLILLVLLLILRALVRAQHSLTTMVCLLDNIDVSTDVTANGAASDLAGER